MGTVFQVPWTRIGTEPADWPIAGLARLKALGFKTAALALTDRSVSIDDPALMAEPRLALVLGTEGDGLTADTIAHCDYTARIPMSHGVDSLNVAAASAVAFWQLRAREGGFPMEIVILIAAALAVCGAMLLRGKAWQSFIDRHTGGRDSKNN